MPPKKSVWFADMKTIKMATLFMDIRGKVVKLNIRLNGFIMSLLSSRPREYNVFKTDSILRHWDHKIICLNVRLHDIMRSRYHAIYNTALMGTF